MTYNSHTRSHSHRLKSLLFPFPYLLFVLMNSILSGNPCLNRRWPLNLKSSSHSWSQSVPLFPFLFLNSYFFFWESWHESKMTHWTYPCHIISDPILFFFPIPNPLFQNCIVFRNPGMNQIWLIEVIISYSNDFPLSCLILGCYFIPFHIPYFFSGIQIEVLLVIFKWLPINKLVTLKSPFLFPFPILFYS